MDSPTRDELKALLKSKLNNCKLSRASSSVKQEKLDKVKADIEKILEPSGIDPDTFIKNVLKNNGK
jgi:hypothetical protein